MVELSPQMNNLKLFFCTRKLLWFEITKMLIAVNEKNLLCHLLYILTQFRSVPTCKLGDCHKTDSQQLTELWFYVPLDTK